MIGQGRPKASPGRDPPTARAAAVTDVFRGALVALLALVPLSLRGEEMRLRIAWGGGPEHVWQATISVSNGSLADPRPLGVEADEPGSMWLADNGQGSQQLIVKQRSPRSYDGVDVSLTAPTNAKLLARFSSGDDSAQPISIEIPLIELSRDYVNKELDSHGSRLLVMRTPGDSLRVSFEREQLVFAPGDRLKCMLEPHALPLPEGGRAKLKVQLLNGVGKELWSQQHDVQAGAEMRIPLDIPLPAEEGVYDVAIAAANSSNWSQAVRQPLNWKRTIAERRVQLLVLGPQRPLPARAAHELTQIIEIDPANPGWFDKLNKLPQLQLTRNRLPRILKGPLGDDCLQTRHHDLGELAQLSPNAESPDAAWQGYWLPIAQPGRPHILEVDYPSDVSQTLGISIVEPNAAGALVSIGLDSGFDHEAKPVGATGPRWRHHRLVFWPRTNTPLALISNGRERAPAVYGKIRVLVDGERLPRLLPKQSAANRRLLAAYLDRPLIPENFSADEALDPWSGRSLDDWWTFYEGGTRLVEYLHYAGYNGLMLGVLADGSTIYPSARLMPTPRYDTGTFFATGQDPVRKDVLEMLLRLFDREDLQLIPSVEFAAPLPELEAIRRGGGTEAEGIEWIGADGAAWSASSSARHGLAPYYNVLHPRVQQAMLGVLHELAERYAQHPSFAGLAVRLSADGYAQLPGPDWGLDDATMARFARESGLHIPSGGSQRFAQRAALLREKSPRQTWLEWRAAELGKFYRRMGDELATIRPGARLYLAGAGMLSSVELEPDLRPTLPRQTTMAKALLRMGIDVRQYQDDQQHIVLLRPERVLPQTNLSARAVDLEISQTADFDTCFQGGGTPGSLFFHQPRELRLTSFDQKSPFKPSYTWLVCQPVPSGQENRQRFVHSLAALDSQVIFDGGWLLPMGQEETTRDLAAAYRALPAARFQTVGNRPANEAVQPLTFRTVTHGNQTYLYGVNDAPFPTTARLHVEAGPSCHIEELTGMRKVSPLQSDGEGKFWEVRLEPYDLVAVRFSEPNVQCSNLQAAWAGTVETALGAQIRGLGARAAVLRNPPPLDVVANPGFERTAAAGENPIPDWAILTRSGATVELDRTQKHGGQQSVKMSSNGAVACLVSRPFPSPSTGRLSLAVWLRVADANRQPPLRLAVEGKLPDRDYYSFAQVGMAPGPNQPAAPILTTWRQYVFQVDDLPLEGLTSLRVRFDLMGAGEVWVDDVQVFGLVFKQPELVELSKLITLAEVKLQNGQIGDCLRLLEGYWPRFLEENVPLPAGGVPSDAAAAQPHPPEEKPPERSGWLNRVRDFVPESLRF